MAIEKSSTGKFAKALAAQKAYIAKREKGYREQALKLYPWLCGRCGREFTHKNVSELTVHHIDHDHDNNPSDGSNWELLCIYCHDEEHTKYVNFVRYGNIAENQQKPATHNPFADLKAKLEGKPQDNSQDNPQDNSQDNS